jgi:hypothetical protein
MKGLPDRLPGFWWAMPRRGFGMPKAEKETIAKAAKKPRKKDGRYARVTGRPRKIDDVSEDILDTLHRAGAFQCTIALFGRDGFRQRLHSFWMQSPGVARRRDPHYHLIGQVGDPAAIGSGPRGGRGWSFRCCSGFHSAITREKFLEVTIVPALSLLKGTLR